MNTKIYELIILGCGPAGITAAIYAARKKMDFIIISKDIGGQTIYSSEVENYTGYQVITGAELVLKFKEHLDMFDVELHMPEVVKRVEKENDTIKVETDRTTYYSKTLIISTGRTPRNLGAKNEERFKGRGLTYCATCDAPLFRDKTVAVIGGGNSALDAAIQLTKYAKKIYLIDIAESLKADPVMIKKAFDSGIVEYIKKSKVTEINGTNFVESIKIESLDSNKESILDVQGVFVEIGSIASSDFIDIVAKTKDGEIIVDCMNKTSQEAIFAAGDVTNVFAKQIIIACGEGAKAALSAYEYLSKKI
ncbi:MAG: FAD-dependent oxidoreductase [Endomicrobiia bacterium]